MASSIFDSLPLDPTKFEFRLWTFLEDDVNQDPKLVLMNFDGTSLPPYIALSYTWGDLAISKHISVNDQQLSITENLWDFITMLHHTGEFTDTWFFADQISMNQGDLLERNHQVTLMGSIYTRAHSVFAWLATMKNAWYWSDTSKIVRDPYWTRLWVVQELHLAGHLSIWCGNISMTRDDLLDDLSKLWGTEEVATEVETMLESSAQAGQRSLFDVVLRHHYCQCSDSRDKFFGLQALVAQHHRMPIDYSLTTSEVATRALRIMLPSIFNAHYHRKQDRTVVEEDIWKILTSVGLEVRIAVRLTWSLVITKLLLMLRHKLGDCSYRLSNDVRERFEEFSGLSRAFVNINNLNSLKTTHQRRFESSFLVACADFDGGRYQLNTSSHVSETRQSLGGEATTNEDSSFSRQAREEQLDELIAQVERVAQDCGLVMYGTCSTHDAGYLSHPDDWPFKDDEPSSMEVGTYLRTSSPIKFSFGKPYVKC